MPEMPGGMPPTARRMAAMSLLENSAEPRVSENPVGAMEGTIFMDASMFPEGIRQGQKLTFEATVESVGSKVGINPSRVKVEGEERSPAGGPYTQAVEGNEGVVDRQGPIEPSRLNA